MPGLQVRECPDSLYRRLVEDAEREHRSIAQQAVAAMARGLGMAENSAARRRLLLARIEARQRATDPASWPDPVALLALDRQR